MLILDKGLNALPALKLSRRVIRLRFWKVFGLFFVLGLLAIAGMFALCIGFLVVIPVAFAVIARLYEDAFGEPDSSTPA